MPEQEPKENEEREREIWFYDYSRVDLGERIKSRPIKTYMHSLVASD